GRITFSATMVARLRQLVQPLPGPQTVDGLFDTLFVANNEFNTGTTYTFAVSQGVTANGFTGSRGGIAGSLISTRATVVGNWTVPDGDAVQFRVESPIRQVVGNSANIQRVDFCRRMRRCRSSRPPFIRRTFPARSSLMTLGAERPNPCG